MQIANKIVGACTIVLAALATCVPVATASAGAPDPTFGTAGVLSLRGSSNSTGVASGHGDALLLPDGSTVSPTFRLEYGVKNGTRTRVKRRLVRLEWASSAGRVTQRSAWMRVPADLMASELLRATDGHLLLVGGLATLDERTYNIATRGLYVLRLSATGTPEAEQGSTSAEVVVPVATIPHLAAAPAQTSYDGASVAPNGRVYLQLRQSSGTQYGPPSAANNFKRGPNVIAAIDPSRGLATDFAGGSLLIAAATDARSTTALSTLVDEGGRLLVAARTTKSAIGGTNQAMTVTRYDVNGTVDPTYAGGRASLVGATIDTAYYGVPSMLLMRNGDLLVRFEQATEENGITARGIELRRLLPNGDPALTFGNGGRAVLVLQRAKSDNFSSSSLDVGTGAQYSTFEQADGKLLLELNGGSGFTASRYGTSRRGDVVRLTTSGTIDTTYESRGFARIDAPNASYASSGLIGIDPQGRLVASLTSADDGGVDAWIVRLLGGDQPASPGRVQFSVDRRAACGSSAKRSCFDADGSVQVTGRATAAGRPVAGATIVMSVTRAQRGVSGYALVAPVARTRADGRFTVRVPRAAILPGSWKVTGRMLATPASQRVDRIAPTYFTLGPRADIAMLRVMHNAQALAGLMEYILDDSESSDTDIPDYCDDVSDCVGRSKELSKLVSATSHPEPGRVGLLFPRRGAYTIVTRADTDRYRLEFVVSATPDGDYEYSCRGDAAARKRWCPLGSWLDSFDDPFAVAGIDGTPFDY